ALRSSFETLVRAQDAHDGLVDYLIGSTGGTPMVLASQKRLYLSVLVDNFFDTVFAWSLNGAVALRTGTH
ncbi:MAG: hypothetical protein Q7V40_03060, partial [Pseudolabrys sp.]|nr:hypothetical protein [Pseudolabrys sp.]